MINQTSGCVALPQILQWSQQNTFLLYLTFWKFDFLLIFLAKYFYITNNNFIFYFHLSLPVKAFVKNFTEILVYGSFYKSASFAIPLLPDEQHKNYLLRGNYKFCYDVILWIENLIYVTPSCCWFIWTFFYN